MSLALAFPKAVDISPLRHFVTALGTVLSETDDEDLILVRGSGLLADLVAHDDWLPAAFAIPHPDYYRQYLLHCDSRERFSVVAFIWGPGQSTPIHDHRVWGLVGILRGEELVEKFERDEDGRLARVGQVQRLRPGEVDILSPRIGDVHRVSNGLPHAVSVSIHVYGANIGAVERAVFDLDGTARPFISGYANDVVPNIWDRSKSL
ncbi:3-mercaptopropionate dioxygenase [Sphingobium jiangsuense]|uniref:Putative metal-dependent enzyme (Double-stranded beta helix superfamily) n=1 Tax=Sphingobium jiangsuense TaxID=870476 RepID=A0A7W6BGC5_9SPHN|nr:cysteine dioxygenase [Sphingobium jiangsuense]MBB3924591.1 putative metal-dependent enzyme (double-stranded beta helix superfamily) [Sphingobium jiangsuense]GLT01709.1 3-mercaptopropionate dioxygenase [Sphingobium jiangsuense]